MDVKASNADAWDTLNEYGADELDKRIFDYVLAADLSEGDNPAESTADETPGYEWPEAEQPASETPRTLDDMLADARSFTEDTAPAEVEALVMECTHLGPLQKRKLFTALKKATGTPLGALVEVEQARANVPDAKSPDHLDLARSLVQVIGPDDVLAAISFIWIWSKRGVWQRQEDRAIKQRVQDHIAEQVSSVRKTDVESVADLFHNEVYRADHAFDVGPPECVNTLNGELELEAGAWRLRPHNREHYRTTQIPVAYDPEANAPRFMSFMAEVFNGDTDAEDKARAILEMIGFTLMAHCRHERFIILVGTGANGKSVLMALLEALCGAMNVAGVQPSQFGRSFQRAHLHAKLANIVTEIKQGEVIDDASLKGIVSGEPTTVEHKFRDPFVMRSFATCWFGTNHMPHTRDFSDALFRRALVVEFNQVFKPELGNCDPQLKDKLMGELPGILNLALGAYAKAVRDGFTNPPSCLDARDRWRLEADQAAQFVDECCKTGAGWIVSSDLFRHYREWALSAGVKHTLTQKNFSERIERLGFTKRHTRSGRVFDGLAMLSASNDYGTNHEGR